MSTNQSDQTDESNQDNLGESEMFVSVIVPAMNEEGNIEKLCELFAEMFSKADFPGELVLINDGSTDKTLEKIRQAVAKYDFIVCHSHLRNRGLTAALQTGFSAARGDVYVFYPADLQFLPDDIPAMIQKIRDGADIVTGWKQGNYRKKFVSNVYNWLSRAIFGTKVHDLNSVKAFRAEILTRLFLRSGWHRYLVVMAEQAGYVVDEVKVTLYEREWGDSKFNSLWRIPIGVLDMIAVKFQIDFMKKPLILFGGLGGSCFLFSFLVGVYAVYERYLGVGGDRALLFLVMLLAGLGLGFFILGMLAEALTGVREEVSSMRETLLEIREEDNE
ncbi:glycosyltransferase family 2 protein [Gemmatimonas aurantiaca]|nr:glycosyltransferase family 2 protein [Gemmatimonas aurantiaca]